MTLHHAIVWVLRIEQTRKMMRHCEEIPAPSFQKHWVAGPLGSYAVATVRYYTTSLIEDIELWLRERIEAELKRTHGARWWDVLPSPVQQ